MPRIFPLLAAFLQAASLQPLIVVPPYWKWDAVNELLITPRGPTNNLVDIKVEITAQETETLIFRQTMQAKIAGSTNRVKFKVPGGKSKSKTYKVAVKVQNDENFETIVQGGPNLRTVYIQTDKAVYKPTELVRVRSLSITNDGTLYSGAMEFSLVNPDGFELIKKIKESSDRFQRIEFPLPEHLNFGVWKIVAHPIDGDKKRTFSSTFEVQNYVVPPFRVHMLTKETNDADLYDIFVLARHAHGRAVSGPLTLRCRCLDGESRTDRTPCILSSSEINDGQWFSTINIQKCAREVEKHQTVITAEVLDSGSGNRVKTDHEIDTEVPGFELVPLKPGFVRNTPVPILVRTRGDGVESGGQRVVVNVRCISMDKAQTKKIDTYNATVGELFNIENRYEHSCRVLQIEARRAIGDRYSRPVQLVLPSVDGIDSLHLSWISQTFLSKTATYNVGDKFRTILPIEHAPKLNYIVMCGEQTVAEAGRVRDDGEINFEITTEMVPQCVLFVYSASAQVRSDMMLFFVESKCKFAVTLSKPTISVGENLTVTLYGGRGGLTLLSAVDIRMLEILEKYSSDDLSTNYWDISFFSHPELKYHQARLFNFLDIDKLMKKLKETCEDAGVLQLQHMKQCATLAKTSSTVSSQCSNALVLACDRLTDASLMGTVCDRTGKNCGGFKLAGSHLEVMMMKFSKGVKQEDVVKTIDASTIASKIRQYFPKVWLFGDYQFGTSNQLELNVTAPDSVTQWSVQSSTWIPSKLTVCKSNEAKVVSQKNLFIDVDLPKHVYVNESVTAHVSVIAEKVDEEIDFSICMRDLERHVCGDVGSRGERGEPAYTRIHLTPKTRTSSKIFTLRFLSVGETEVVFILKKEFAYPGRYHCDVGELYDAVSLKLIVGKRAETEEHFKRLILNPRKPLNRLTRPLDVHYLLLEGDNMRRRKNIIEYHEYRTESAPRLFYANVSINLPDTENIYSITVDVSQFLSESYISDETDQNSSISPGRIKRDVDENESFLTDVITSLAGTLYRFKSLNLLGEKNYQKFEKFENNIASLMSTMLTFTDCRGTNQCAFSQFRNPQKNSERSLFLTALSTSLLCEASVDERIICPLLKYMLNSLEKNINIITDDFLKHLDLMSDSDRSWFVKSVLHHLAHDCAAYQCLRNDRAWINLRKNFFNLSDRTPLDVRTVAALAFMAPKSTRNIMRIKLYAIAKDGMLPYWSAGKASGESILAKLRSRFNDLVGRRVKKSGDLLANSLGLLAFVSQGVDPIIPAIELDLLADWIYEQLNDADTTVNALDAFYANRAIYEYRWRKAAQSGRSRELVVIECTDCKPMIQNVTDAATLFYLPTTVRNMTIITHGDAKVRVGIRVLAAKRMRTRRGLEQNDFLPVTINVVQQFDSLGVMRHEVCVVILSGLIETLEITHGLFTGFTTSEKLFRLLPNTTAKGVRVVDRIGLSTIAAHFVLINLKPKEWLCYELGITEPQKAYEPNQLAPVAITARHPSYDIVGQSLLMYSERYKRSTVEEAIDLVCWDGRCSCAEASCTVRCGECLSTNRESLQKELCAKNWFGATVDIEAHRIETTRDDEFFVIEVSVKHWKQGIGNMAQKPETLEVWLRLCNIRCAEPKVGDTYYISGNLNGIIADYDARLHYVLREDDRWEKASEECQLFFSQLITSPPCAMKQPST